MAREKRGAAGNPGQDRAGGRITNSATQPVGSASRSETGRQPYAQKQELGVDYFADSAPLVGRLCSRPGPDGPQRRMSGDVTVETQRPNNTSFIYVQHSLTATVSPAAGTFSGLAAPLLHIRPATTPPFQVPRPAPSSLAILAALPGPSFLLAESLQSAWPCRRPKSRKPPDPRQAAPWPSTGSRSVSGFQLLVSVPVLETRWSSAGTRSDI
jgi:hypothetical protein